VRFLRRLSLRHQQLLFFAVVTVSVVIVVGLATSVSARYTRTFGESLNRYLNIHELREVISSLHTDLQLYARTGDDDLLASIYAREPVIEGLWNSIEALEMSDRSSRFELRATRYGLLAYRRGAYQLIDFYGTGSESFVLALTYTERIHGYIDEYLERLFRIQLDRGRVEYQSAVASQDRLRNGTVGGIALIGAALVLFAHLFSRSVTLPLERLVSDAHAIAEGDFGRPAHEIPESADLREVALAFNAMSAGIGELINDLRDKQQLERQLHQQELTNVQMERLLRESQLVALQSQVNPHFLFNTLNSIARTARVEEAARSEDLIRGLSGVLRYILRNPRASVSLREEMRVAVDYLSLQRVRFGPRLSAETDIDPSVENAQIPPLSLQPLVENAVIYGIEPMEEGGTVRIEARPVAPEADSPAAVIITVSDNGAGMTADTVAHLLQDAPDTFGRETTGIGVLNVRARLALFYGENHSFSIESSTGSGTSVSIVVPLVTESIYSAGAADALHSTDRR
jgi:two-component system sensor histidine kinase YesM